jgi:hypothetical protein
MKGKDKGIYWGQVTAKDGYETEHCIYPKDFIIALGDAKEFNELVKAKIIKKTDPPRDVSSLKNPKKIYKQKVK